MNTPRTATSLAVEAADCIEDNDLRGEELRAYLTAWIAECALRGDLTAMARDSAVLSADYAKVLAGMRLRVVRP